FTRYQGVLSPGDGTARLDAPAPLHHFDALSAYDREVTGTDRVPLLRSLAEEHPESLRIVVEDGQINGFLMSRPGTRARQIGPCIADHKAGPLLLADARERYTGEPVFVDIPVGHTAAEGWASSSGLTAARHLTRMTRGTRIDERLDRLWASAGPEKG